MKMNRKMCLLLLVCLCSFVFGGCVRMVDKTGKLRDMDFTVVSEERYSEELKNIIEERKNEPFKLTYTDKEYLYICVGYGEQQSGGYSIVVDELYEAENSIMVKTTLLGPKEKIEGKEIASYPVVVIKLENTEKPVVFE